jgi:23S rRNA (uracil1939-C5)-methyltransferase
LELAGLPDDLRAALEEEGRWIRAPRPFGYRNKAVLLPVVRKGRLVLGAFSRGTHHVVDLAGCPVLSPPLEAAAATLRDLLEPVVLRGRRTLRPPGTRRSEGAGAALRALILRGNRAGELLLTFVVDDAEAQDWLWPAVRRLLPAPDGGGDTEDERKGERVASRGGLRGIFLSVQAGEGDAVAGGEPPTLLRGVQHLDENVGGLSLRLLPLGFFQVHVEALEALAERVAQASRGASRILDLYCGGGVLGMLAARAAGPAGAELAGIDASLPGIEAARLDAARNGVAAEFRAGTPATCLRADDGDADLAILDPPRSGARAEDLKALLDLAPRRILYVSCHAASLARDARIVGAAGYRAIRLSPADMLPQTPHVEWLAEFERGS